MAGKLAALLGTFVIVTVFLLPGTLARQEQDESVKKRAVEQIREIANSIKQCPEQGNNFEDDCQIHYFYVGPPTNLEWDVLPSKTVRSPFQGVIEFTLPTRSKDIDKTNLPKKQQQKCAAMAAANASIQADVLANLMKQGPQPQGHYRYEFDVGSNAPELVKILWVVKDKDGKETTSAVTYDPQLCWMAKAKSVGSTPR